MLCPSCAHPESKVVDSRPAEEGSSIRRRRECLNCGSRFTTYERMGEYPLIVIKSDGSSEAFDRSKLMRGLLIACAKRPVSAEQLDSLINKIESDLRSSQKYEIRSKDLGSIVMSHLLSIDEVAYVRFASVYKDFQSAEEFASTLKDLKGKK